MFNGRIINECTCQIFSQYLGFEMSYHFKIEIQYDVEFEALD